jgi:hypothetical protein
VCGSSDFAFKRYVESIASLDWKRLRKRPALHGNLNTVKQFLDSEAQRSCDLFDIHQRDISLTAFDSTYIGTIKATEIGELFLRHP